VAIEPKKLRHKTYLKNEKRFISHTFSFKINQFLQITSWVLWKMIKIYLAEKTNTTTFAVQF